MSTPMIRQRVQLPYGLDARMWMTQRWIVLWVNGKTCVAHPGWMDDMELTELASVMTEAARSEG